MSIEDKRIEIEELTDALRSLDAARNQLFRAEQHVWVAGASLVPTKAKLSKASEEIRLVYKALWRRRRALKLELRQGDES